MSSRQHGPAVHHHRCPPPTADCPVIIVAGRAWPMPPLAPRQNRIVVPLLVAGSADYESLSTVVFTALTRAHPALSRSEFDEWPVPYYELVDAVSAIAQQTGMVKPRRAVSSLDPAPSGAHPPTPDALRRADAGLNPRGPRGPDWDAIIAQFVNFLPGTTPDYWEDALTVPRLEAMTEEWRLHPPLAVLVAGYVGYKPKPRDADAVEELMRLFPGGQLKLN